ncbi:protein FAM166C A [Electrophorus electricus]|uniref:protein FAM166C A n=1 Tax=Electrophorus electricus TaxID=8005 RepID=UPI0015D07B1B|nr:protein FAM166C A [Electrophorus electricus]
MQDMTFRGNGTLITHNNATYLPSSLMPGYCGHVPNAKFLYGDTFGNATIKYFQDFRCAAMASSASAYSKGGMFPSIYSNADTLVIAQRSMNRDRALNTPYWARYNVHFNRQREIVQFAELAQKHRGNYNDQTGTLQPVPFFCLPLRDTKQHTQQKCF